MVKETVATTSRTDGYSHDPFTLQQLLADALVERGFIRTPAVEAAFRHIPRHLFVPHVSLARAYDRRSIPTWRRAGNVISSSSAPPVMASMLEALDLASGQRVLEIGAGTGFNAALLAHIVGPSGEVVTLDLDDEIVEDARLNLDVAGVNTVRVVKGDGANGFPAGAPFDRIVLTAAAPDLSPAWCEQLAADGRLLVPLQLGGMLTQKLVAFHRDGDHLTSDMVGECVFLTMRSAYGHQRPKLRLARGLRLSGLDGGAAVDPAVLAQLLADASRDHATGLLATPDEIRTSLLFWLGLHEPDLVRLSVDVERAGAPRLISYPSSGKQAITVGLAGQAGAAFLTRSTDVLQHASCAETATPVDVVVRGFGVADDLVRRLRAWVAAWHLDGRRSGAGLRVRAYPAGATLPPRSRMAGAVMVRKPSTTLVLDWPPEVACAAVEDRAMMS